MIFFTVGYIADVRKELSKHDGERKQFSGVFVRLGAKVNYKGYKEETILLKNITDLSTNTIVTDHIWFAYTKGFQEINLIEGRVITFDARVKAYSKGYVNKALGMNKKKTDFKLSHPTKIKMLA